VRTIPFGWPVIGDEERAAVMEVLRGPVLTHGPRVKEFEAAFARFTGADHSIATASCTAALHLCYFYLGLGRGDEVIVPAQTHVATAHAVEYCGAKPVFVDSEINTGNLDLEKLEHAITENTRALSVVHYLGMPVDMDRVCKIAKKHNLFVVEDCALAIGACYKGIHLGLHGDAGCFSFYPVKHITTAEGGMLITKHARVASEIARQRAFGIDRNVVAERAIPGQYDVQGLGFNYRLNEIGAALGLEQMKRVPEFLKKRRENYEMLSRGLREIEELELFSSSHGQYQSSYYCHSVMLKEPLQKKRLEIIEYLKGHGVGTSIYYPRPVPEMTYYRNKYGYPENCCPVASRISVSSIALPVGPHVDAEDIDYILETIKAAIMEVK